jgi:hypothetical protein
MPRQGRRYARIPLSGLVAALVAALLGWAALATGSYSPLATGSTYGSGSAVRIAGISPNRDVLQLPFAPGTDQVLRFSVANDGRWAVTIDGVRTDDLVGLALVRARAVQRSRHGRAEGAELPVRLAPHEELELEVTYRITPCGLAPGSGASYDALAVRWHAFGRHHVSDVPQPIVSVTAPHVLPSAVQQACPASP